MSTALEQVRDKLSEVFLGSQSYRTDLTELQSIVSELSAYIDPVVVVKETHSAHGSDVNVTVVFSFSLDSDTAEQINYADSNAAQK